MDADWLDVVHTSPAENVTLLNEDQWVDDSFLGEGNYMKVFGWEI